MWLQPPLFWMGAPQPAQGLVCAATHDSFCEAAVWRASRSMLCHARACRQPSLTWDLPTRPW